MARQNVMTKIRARYITEYLEENGSITTREMMRLFQLHRESVNNLVNHLLEQGNIEKKTNGVFTLKEVMING